MVGGGRAAALASVGSGSKEETVRRTRRVRSRRRAPAYAVPRRPIYTDGTAAVGVTRRQEARQGS